MQFWQHSAAVLRVLAARRNLLVFVIAIAVAHPTAYAEINHLHLGAQFDSARSQVTFRVFSSRATHLELYLYARPSGADEVARIPLDHDASTGVWSVTLPVSKIRNDFGISGTIYYGYRAWGPNWPFDPTWTKGSKAGFISDVDANGSRFNPNKLLFDPYARELSHDPVTPSQRDGSIYASGPDHFLEDTGRMAPKGIVLEEPQGDVGSKPTRGLKDDIIYEVHLRGLTEADKTIPKAVRGTFAGAALKTAYLKELGVTAVEQAGIGGIEPLGAVDGNEQNAILATLEQ